MGTTTVVVPVFNRWDLTLACLFSLKAARAAEAAAGRTLDVVVVDNASTDRTVAELRRYSWVRTLRMTSNLGFARACNAGLDAAEGDVVAFLNNDTVVEPGWLPPLRAALDDPGVGLVGSLATFPLTPGKIQHAGMAFDLARMPIHLHYKRPLDEVPGAFRRKALQCVTGASIAMRTDDARGLGGFDVRYLNSWEDVDLCFRVRRAGLFVVYEPASRLLHHEGQTDGRHEPVSQRRNSEIFYEDWGADIVCDADAIAAADLAPG